MDFQARREFQSTTAAALPGSTPANPTAPKVWLSCRAILTLCLKFVLVAIVAFGSFQIFSRFAFQSVQVVGASMTPTLHDTGRYILNRLVYQIRDPRPQEIVVLRDPSDNTYAIKRIVAKEGDTVLVKDGHLFVNGKILPEPYLNPNTPTYAGPRYREQLWVCGVKQYFVLGDNRNNSADSRIYGTISRENILGMVSP